ncbi:MAG: biotin/lipoyl-binding protein, partial [Rhodospirillales bacterium]|nr:biotin/lipoyl-binding protein [Rhodospirillales bacterium]
SPAPAPAPSPSRAAATAPMAQPAAQPPPAAAAGGDLCAPLAGVLHLQSAPGAPPFVREGDAVEAGAVLCVIEAMKVFNTVRAEQAGTIAAILVASGSEVEAGQLLMQIA